MTIKRFKRALLLCGLIAVNSMHGLLASVEVPRLHNLQQTGREILQGCRPLLLEFVSEYCEYCTLLEEEVLKPIRRNRDYDQRVVMRKVILGSAASINGLDGKPTNADELATHYKIYVTPTLVFVDERGMELAERMVGVTTLDFYGGYLDQALDTAKHRLKEKGNCQQENL